MCEQQMAVEMVLTLGQAFEVAYQLAMLKNGSADTADVVTTAPPVNRLWRPPVKSVKPRRSPLIADGASVTVGLR